MYSEHILIEKLIPQQTYILTLRFYLLKELGYHLIEIKYEDDIIFENIYECYI